MKKIILGIIIAGMTACASAPIEKTSVIMKYDCISQRCIDHAKEVFDACCRRHDENKLVECKLMFKK